MACAVWDALARRGYDWWVERFRHLFSQFDCIRVDHFRGFESAWHVPAGHKTAAKGDWVTGPGRHLFDALISSLGPLPIIAEDLGVITHEVESLRDSYGFPGMKILQFAFGSGPANAYLPHNHIRHSVVYTGTHDNNTVMGWWNSTGGDATRTAERAREAMRAAEQLLSEQPQTSWGIIRLQSDLARLRISQGDLEGAAFLILKCGLAMDRLPEVGEISFARESAYVALVHLHLARGNCEAALALSERLLQKLLALNMKPETEAASTPDVDGTLTRLGIASRSDVAALERQVEALSAELEKINQLKSRRTK